MQSENSSGNSSAFSHSAIEASRFYGNRSLNHQSANVPPHSKQFSYISALQKVQQKHLHHEEDSELFQIFARQDAAFHAFDALQPNLQCRSKVYTYEGDELGKRHFLLTENDIFLRKYFEIPLHRRHVYEIIRHSFPCRLYFDLEYHRPSNSNVDGAALTEQWIMLVLWKLQELYEILARKEDVLVVDSTTDEKFSKHIIISLHDVSVPSIGKELLFADNQEMSLFVRAILLDISRPTTTIECEANTEETGIVIDGIFRTPYAEYRCFWMNTPKEDNGGNNSDTVSHRTEIINASSNRSLETEFKIDSESMNSSGSKKQFFVDTGVYTKNRAFRLYGSCKHGKQKMLGIDSQDEQRYYRFKLPITLKSSQLATAKRKAIMTRAYIIPVDVLMIAPSSSSSEMCLPSLSKPSPSAAVDYCTFASFLHLFNANKYHILPRLHNLQCLSSSSASNKRKFELVASALESSVNDGEAAHRNNYDRFFRQVHNTCLLPSRLQIMIEPGTGFFMSPTASAVFRGSNPAGYRSNSNATSWKQQIVVQSRAFQEPTPFVSTFLDKFLTWYFAQTQGRFVQGRITQWMLFQQFNRNGMLVYKLRCMIGGNRYCQAIGRVHKSNGIYVECDLMARAARQRCWDVDCQSFDFPEVVIPSGLLPEQPEEVIRIIEEYKASQTGTASR